MADINAIIAKNKQPEVPNPEAMSDFIGMSPDAQSEFLSTYDGPYKDQFTDITKLSRPTQEALLAAHKGSLSGGTQISGPLTLMQRLAQALRGTVRAAPEMAGFGAGAIYGGIPGAMGGAAVGKGLENTLDKVLPGVSRFVAGYSPNQDPRTAQNWGGDLVDSAKSAALAGLFEGGGRAIGRTLSGPKYTPAQTNKMNIWDREGIPYTPGDVKPRSILGSMENVAEGSIAGGGIMETARTNTAMKMLAFKNRVLQAMGPLLKPGELGQELQNAVKTNFESLVGKGGFFERSYAKLSTLYNTPVDTALIRNEVTPIRDEIAKQLEKGRMPGVSTPETPSRFKIILDDLSKYGTVQKPGKVATAVDQFGNAIGGSPAQTINKTLTFQDVWKDKQLVEQTIRNMGQDDPLRTQAKGMLKRLDSIMDNAMEKSAIRAGAPDLHDRLRILNASYKTAKELYETKSLVSDLPNMDPEDIAKKFFARDQVTPINDLWNAISPADRPRLQSAVQRQLVENMFDNMSSISAEGIPVVSGKVLSRRLLIDKNSMDLVFKNNSQDLQAIKDFADASLTARGNLVNPQSGGQVMRKGELNSAMGFLTDGTMAIMTGKPTESGFLLKAISPISSPIIAKLVTNPTMAKFLMKGFGMSPTAAMASGWTTRALNILRIETDSVKNQMNQSPYSQ